MRHLIPEPLQRLRALVVRKPPEEELTSTEHSRDNIAHHYDLSNELFGLFLDETMSYSSALFPRPARLSAGPRDRAGPQDRAAARRGRGRRGHPGARDRHRAGASCRSGPPGGVRPSAHHPLHRAAGAGPRADRRSRAHRPGAGRPVRLPRRRGEYDAVLSVEMIEAVGTSSGRRTSPPRPASRAAAAGSGSRRSRCRTTGCSPPARLHLDQQVHLPRRLPPLRRRSTRSPAATRAAAGDRLSLGSDYAETLRRWDEAFLAASGPVLASVSTTRSCGCGTSTSSTRGPVSPPATSTSTS